MGLSRRGGGGGSHNSVGTYAVEVNPPPEFLSEPVLLPIQTQPKYWPSTCVPQTPFGQKQKCLKPHPSSRDEDHSTDLLSE